MSLQKVTTKDLLPGDIILCRGKDMISDIISKMDGSPYSHATLYIGNNMICEADFDGILNISIDKIKNEEKYGDVYRFNKDGHHFSDTDWSVDPVITVGQNYVNNGIKYAFSHLILLSLIVLTRRIPLPPIEAKIIRHLVDEGTQKIFDLLDRGKTPMVCSELVYRCFYEALPSPKYKLDITYPYPKHEYENYSNTTLNHKELTESLKKFSESYIKAKGSNILFETKDHVDPACISPRDLANSPDLQLLGRLSFE